MEFDNTQQVKEVSRQSKTPDTLIFNRSSEFDEQACNTINGQFIVHLYINFASLKFMGKGLSMFENLKTLALNSCNGIEVPYLFSAFKVMTQLESLELNFDKWVNDQVLKDIVKHFSSRLTHLEVEQSQISEQGFDQLCQLSKLQALNCGGTKIAGETLVSIAKSNTQIDILCVSCLELTYKTMYALSKLLQLSSLDMSYSSGVNSQIIELFPGLTEINLKGTSVSTVTVEMLCAQGVRVIHTDSSSHDLDCYCSKIGQDSNVQISRSEEMGPKSMISRRSRSF